MDESDMDEGVTSLEDHRERSLSGDDGATIRKRPPKRRAPSTRDPGSQVRRLECFPEVDQMIREGTYLRQVANFIHQDRGELTDLSLRAVIFMLRDYRDYVFSDDAVLDGEAGSDRPDEDDPFYELYSMQKLYRAMEKRIEMETETERNLTKLFSTTHKEFLTAARLGETIMKRKEKLGLLRKERGGVRQRVGSGMPGRIDIAQVVANPESRQRVMGFVETLIQDPDLLDNLSQGRFVKPKAKKVSRPKRNKRGKQPRRPAQPAPSKK